jgi:UDP-N-acetylglucosamine 2-epimerase (non-hydrolysing)
MMSSRPINVLHVVGARPNFVKVAALMHAMAAKKEVFQQTLVHTGQHYDPLMSDIFFHQLEIPVPDIYLDVGSGTHAVQTALIMQRFESVVLDRKPDWVVVVGDVNSTLACALVCAKIGVRVAHVEAGLRSFDRGMPEEINRVLTDQVSDLLLTSEEIAQENLLREGISSQKIHFVGNVMIDTLTRLLPLTEGRSVLRDLGLDVDKQIKPFVLVTLHRPSNVDDPSVLLEIASALSALAKNITVIFPVHPRTRERVANLEQSMPLGQTQLIEALGYLDFLALERQAALVVTDSGGIQEETTFLGVSCLTVRPNTERPVTISQGTNRLVEPIAEKILAAAHLALEKTKTTLRQKPSLWDGHAAKRIVDVLRQENEAAEAGR